MNAIEAAARASGTPVETMRAFARTLTKRHAEAAKKPATTVALRERGGAVKPAGESSSLVAEFRRGGLSTESAKVAARGRSGLREVVTKTEPAVGSFKGGDFPASDYAYVPDAADPAGWALLLTLVPGGTPDPDAVKGAVAAIDPANPADNPVPEADLPDVKAALAKAWAKAGLPADQVPAVLTTEALRAEFRRGGLSESAAKIAASGRI